jgi:hypothetical protein
MVDDLVGVEASQVVPVCRQIGRPGDAVIDRRPQRLIFKALFAFDPASAGLFLLVPLHHCRKDDEGREATRGKGGGPFLLV